MANTTIELGDIAIAVGSYKKGDKEHKARRRIGKLMETTYEDGGKSLWIKLNQEALSPSLLICARPFTQKGSDTVLLDVFRPDKDKAAPGEPAPDDGEPY